MLDVDLEASVAVGHVDVVAHLALDRDVAHQALHGLGVDAWQVAGVGIPVRVAVTHVEEEHEVVAAFDIGGDGGRRCSGHGVHSFAASSFALAPPARAARRLMASARSWARWW